MPRSLIVLSFDALATSPLAAYGCSWLETPGLNRLAASSIVFDRIVASSVFARDCLAGFLRDRVNGESVAAAAAAAGLTTLLFTDSPEAAQLGSDDLFDHCVRVDGFEVGSGFGSEADDVSGVADEIEETQFARLLAAALAHREKLDEAPVLLWIHFSSLARCWDAPLALRTADVEGEEEEFGEEYSEEYRVDGDDEEEESEGLDRVSEAEVEAARQSDVPPNFRLSDDADPDLMLAWMAAYGGQVRAIDALVDVLLDTIEDGPATDLVVASTSGFALGEHRWLGPAVGPPRSPRIHLPLIIHRGGGTPLRSLHLASSDRLAATLIEMIRGEASADGDRSLLRDAAPDRWAAPPDPLNPILETITDIRSFNAGAYDDGGSDAGSSDDAERPSLKTAPGWFYCRDAGGNEHLYLKPDDRNDANDIAELEPEVVQVFREQHPKGEPCPPATKLISAPPEGLDSNNPS